jgi:hypothetical protein
MEADFVVSFAEREEYRRQIRLTAYELNIPVIQVKLHPWDGTYQSRLYDIFIKEICDFRQRSH